MDIIGLTGIVVSLALIIILAYKGVHVVVCGALAAVIVALTNGLGATAGYTEIYLSGIGGFFTNNLPIYIWGGIFGVMYNESGAAKSIARGLSRLLRGKKEKLGVFTAILIIFAAGTILSYGGISGIVLMFVLTPLTLAILKESGIPRYMAPGILLGSLATAANSMPGSPQIPNASPMAYLGTSSMAGTVPGFIGGAVVIALNLIYLNWAAKREISKGRGFVSLEGEEFGMDSAEQLPNPLIALIPLVVTFILFNAFKLYIGFSIVIGIVVGVAIFWKYLGNMKNVLKMLGSGIGSGGVLCLSAGALGGFGAVVQATESFKAFCGLVTGINGPPLFIAMFAIVLVTAITGSGPAAIGAALPAFSETFTSMGINPAALHRVTSFSVVTLDTLPSNPGFIAATGLAKAEIKDSYKYVGVCTVLNTLIAAIVVTALLTAFPGLA